MRNKFEVYPGAKIGRWTAQERITSGKQPRWRCVCECGAGRDVLESSLRYGYSLSCGCAKSTQARTAKSEDMPGRQFGELTVLRPVDKDDRRFSAHWLCRCTCGTEVEVAQKQLLSGEVQSCGCRTDLRYRDIAGQQFGRLTALYPLEADDRGSKIWRCRCECGSEIDVAYNTLLYGNTRSCGCKKRERDQVLNSLVSRVAGTSIDHLKSKKIPTNNTTGVKGVYQDKHGRFVARIAFQKKQYFLGAFATLPEAAEARREAEETLNDQVTDFYARWKQHAEQAPEWAEQNPIRIEVEKHASGIRVTLLPKM